MTALRVLAAVALVVMNGFFVASEFALIAARRTRIEQLADEGNRFARILRHSLRELDLMLAGAQLGVALASLLLGFTAEPLVAQALRSLFGAVNLSGTFVLVISGVLALLVVAFFHMVFGEMVPKNIALALPVPTALAIALPFRVFVNLTRYLLRLLTWLAAAGVRLLGAEPRSELLSIYTADEIAAMLVESREQGVIEDIEQELVSGALEFGDLTASEVMIPRTSLVAVPATATVEETEALVVAQGHSRLPVFDGDLDHIVGFVHAKDLLRVPTDRRDAPLDRSLVRPFWVVPEKRKLLPLLVDMRRGRKHFGLVVDEHGGTAGVVALEDVIEELMGEMRDEYDRSETLVFRVGEGRWVCAASLRPDEIEEPTGLELPEGEYETVGGFVLDSLGEIPEPGAEVRLKGWTVRVTRMDGRRIDEVEIVAPREP